MDNTKIAASRVSLLSEQMSDFVGSTVGGGKSYSKKAGFVDILVQVLAFVISVSAFGLKGCDKDSARCFVYRERILDFCLKVLMAMMYRWFVPIGASSNLFFPQCLFSIPLILITALAVQFDPYLYTFIVHFGMHIPSTRKRK